MDQPFDMLSMPPQSASPDESDEVALLLQQFVHDRDVDCPCCGYNLRNLTTPVCPECRHALTLSVAAKRYNIGLLIAATAPGLGAGILAVLLFIMMMIHPGAPTEIVVADAAGILSGLISTTLILKRNWFMNISTIGQVAYVIVTWFLHLIGFLLLAVSM